MHARRIRAWRRFWSIAALCAAALAQGCTDRETSDSDEAVSIPAAASGETARCYASNRHADIREIQGLPFERDVLVLIDRTVMFPDTVRRHVGQQLGNWIGSGTRISIGTFSSYSEAEFARIVFEGFWEPGFPEDARNDAPMGALRQLDSCLAEREEAERDRLQSVLESIFADSRSTMRRSNILANVQEFGARLQGSSSEERLLVIVSDMLENSSEMSFYHNGAMRTIDPHVEFERAAERELLGEFRDVAIFVIGAGLVPTDQEDRHRSLAEIDALERFWRNYFEHSGAQSIEIGKPLLVARAP